MVLNRMNTETTELKVTGDLSEDFNEILTSDALLFVEKLVDKFSERRKSLLLKRKVKQREIDNGVLPDFLPETKGIRESQWTIGDIPQDLLDRRVEITGPVDRKMMINGLNSDASVFMADLEDANSPTWENVIRGQINLRDAVNGSISFGNDNEKKYSLKDKVATLTVRPRGWHLTEKHVLYHGEPIAASLFDFGLFFFHNAKTLISKGSGPYFYLPKLESHHEARLWNDVFIYAQDQLGIPRGTIKATVLIETITAAFEMDEILYELREHSSGLNCGRWDYIFSFIKKFCNKPNYVLPDRSEVTMTVPFMRSYSLLAIKTCHKRNAHAIGGMSAYIPVKNDTKANDLAFEKVREDKVREAKDGHDGTWVAHPGLVPVALEAFNQYMPEKNQIYKKLDTLDISSTDLLQLPKGDITEEGLRTNISVGIQYIASWLSGKGAAPINHLMEDAATAEISRAQIWQWLHNPKGVLRDGRKVTEELFLTVLEDELGKLKEELGEEIYLNGNVQGASELFKKISLDKEFIDFLTIPGYQLLQ